MCCSPADDYIGVVGNVSRPRRVPLRQSLETVVPYRTVPCRGTVPCKASGVYCVVQCVGHLFRL